MLEELKNTESEVQFKDLDGGEFSLEDGDSQSNLQPKVSIDLNHTLDLSDFERMKP